MTKAFYAIMASVIVLLGAFTMTIPYQQASASHDGVFVVVSILKNGQDIGNTASSAGNCGDTCDFEVDLTNRDEGRFNRFCPSNPMEIIVDSEVTKKIDCTSDNGPWSVQIRVATLDSNGHAANHGSPVTVKVKAI